MFLLVFPKQHVLYIATKVLFNIPVNGQKAKSDIFSEKFILTKQFERGNSEMSFHPIQFL